MTEPVPFFFVDVFADRPLTGNPVALLPDADGLSDEVMRAIAREFNQSETAFLLRPSRPGATWRLRSFTPAGIEVFGAGHNAMGAWIWLAETGRLATGESRFAQQIGDDVLAVHVTRESGASAVVTMEHTAPVFGNVVVDRPALSRALGLRESDLVTGVPAQVVSTGAGHLLVQVHDRQRVDMAAPDSPLLKAILRDVGGEGCYVYSRDPHDPQSGAVAYARFFNPTVGIPEDPATGTAAGPLLAALVRSGEVPEGEWIVEQGFALGRPSRLRVAVQGPTVRLSGSGMVVADGTLRL